MTTRIWSAGRIQSARDATVPLAGDATLRGISVFEGLMAYRRPNSSDYAVISLDPHLERLHRSAELMMLPTPGLTGHAVNGIRTLLASETAEQVYLRPTVYLTHGYYGGDIQTDFFVSARPIRRSDGQPISSVISSLRHVPPATYPHEAKIGALYAFYRLARIEAAEAAADEAILLTTDGMVAETPGASVFAVKAGVAYTPPITCGILPSITRTTAITLLTDQLSIKTVEVDITPEFLNAADEVFLTGTMDEIRAVRKIGEQQVGTGSMPITARLSTAYLRACRNGQPAPPAGTKIFGGSRDES